MNIDLSNPEIINDIKKASYVEVLKNSCKNKRAFLLLCLACDSITSTDKSDFDILIGHNTIEGNEPTYIFNKVYP